MAVFVSEYLYLDMARFLDELFQIDIGAAESGGRFRARDVQLPGQLLLVLHEADAAPIIDAPVSELSVQYDKFSKKFLLMTLSGEDIVLRTAKDPQGPWSAPQTVASSAD